MFTITKCLCPFEMLVFCALSVGKKNMLGEFLSQRKIMHNHYRVTKLLMTQVHVPAVCFKEGSSLCVQVGLCCFCHSYDSAFCF